jgi:hypothetical protein
MYEALHHVEALPSRHCAKLSRAPVHVATIIGVLLIKLAMQLFAVRIGCRTMHTTFS